MNTNSVYILTAEAKDLYNSNNLTTSKNNIGYNIRDKNNNINTRKFINTLDFSLDLIKLRDVYKKIFRRKDFTFISGNREYTRHVINVKFNYTHKNFNKCGGIYVASGYQFKDITMNDHICVIDNKLIAIETNIPVTKPYKDLSVLGKHFLYEDGQYKTSEQKFEVIKNKTDLRDYLYENGFICDGIRYVRWKRSSGSSRVGKCLFINESLYERMHKWEMCGLKINDGDPVDLAALEAYISLTSSSIIDTIELKPENFLVVDDYISKFKDSVIGVQIENGELTSKEQECVIENSIFDGETLLDESLFPEKYKNYSMLLLRQRMFKTAGFKARIQKWFTDNNITDISQLNGFTLAKKIEDIKVITTPSSIKYVKFGNIKKWFKILEPTFGIVKHEKPTHYFDGRKVSSHYQLINTLQLSKENIERLLKPSFDYITKLRSDPAILRHHIDYPYKEQTIDPLNSKNEIVFKLLGMNPNFSKTKMYYNFRDDLIRSQIRELKQGHILINGNNSVLLGNGYEMLQHSIGTFKGESIIGYGNIFNKKFEFGKTILASRSPHVCSGNVLISQNIYNAEIDKYFDLSSEIVYVNAIKENIQQRLNGADYDSDSMLLTDDPLLVERASANYSEFKVPTNFINATKIQRYYTNRQKSDLDAKTSINKIGEIINLSQYLNSIFWENINKGQSVQNNLNIYNDICKLAVMSNIEIDKAKKEYELDSEKELNKLKSKYEIKENITDKNTGRVINTTIKPKFFKMIAEENGYKIAGKIKYRYFNTPMDFLYKQVSGFNFNSNREKNKEILPFADIVKPVKTTSIGGTYFKQCHNILDVIQNTKNTLSSLYSGYDNKSEEEKNDIRVQANNTKQECVEYINDLNINQRTMYLLLRYLDLAPYRKCQSLIFTSLFGTPNKAFFKMIQEKQNDIEVIQEDLFGDIELYDLRFSKKRFND